MTTLQQTRPSSKSKARTVAAELERHADGTTTLTINGTNYDLTTYQAECPEVHRVFRLEKRDGTAYDVSEHPHGPERDCPDYEVRHRGLDTLGCKHIKALRAVGLLDAPQARQSVPAATTAKARPRRTSPPASPWRPR